MSEERTLNDAGDCCREQPKAGEGNPERLTGKQRLFRGLKYFALTFVVVFVFVTLAVDYVHPEVSGELKIFAGLLCAFHPALLAGVIVAAFPRRRLWHGLLAVGVAVLVALLMGIA